MPSILLKGGTTLVHDAQDYVHPVGEDLLAEGQFIKRIGKDIQPPPGAKVVDCRNKIISPGFINTHLHTWETQLRGQTGDGLLLDYMVNGILTEERVLQGSQYTPEDAFWGQLAGCLEQIDAGTTTAVESVHVMYSPDHGIRSFFGYAPTPRVKSWNPLEAAPDLLADWVISTLVDIAKGGPYASNRVNISLCFDSLFLAKDIVLPIYDAAKKVGVDYFQSHHVNTRILAPYFSPDITVPALLDSWGLLNDSYLIIHATNPTEKDAEILRRTKAPISSCPSSEYQLAQSEPICFEDHFGLQSQCSIGIDVHNNNSSYIPTEMRLALQYSRGKYNQRFIVEGKVPRKVNHKCEVFNMGTIQGARAVKMGDEIGSLAEGKLADICIFDANSPSMVCGAQYDPVVAIVLHSSPADLEMVIVGGVIRKQNGKLLPADLDQQVKKVAGVPGGQMEWSEVAANLLKSSEAISEKIKECGDLEEVKPRVMAILGVNPENVVDTI